MTYLPKTRVWVGCSVSRALKMWSWSFLFRNFRKKTPFASSTKNLTLKKSKAKCKTFVNWKMSFLRMRYKKSFSYQWLCTLVLKQRLNRVSPDKIPETIAGRISAPVPFSLLKWRIVLLEWFWRSQVIQCQHSLTLITSPNWPTERFHMTSRDSSPLYMVAFDWEIRI